MKEEIKDEKMPEAKETVKKVVKKKTAKKKSPEKIDAIKNSKLPESEKKAYIARLEGKKQNDPKEVDFDVYASIRNFRSGEKAGKKALAKSKNKVKMKQKEWDDFFKKF